MEAIETFELAAKAVSTRVVRSSASGLEQVVENVLRESGTKRIVSDSRRVALASFDRAEPAVADAGITDAEWGIAATGSLILPMTPERHRSTSLVPPISVVILDASRILPDLPTAISYIGDTYMKPDSRPSSVVLVTGPSRTADIELNLVTGVHGPKELIVILVSA